MPKRPQPDAPQGAPVPKLTEEQQRWIVRQFAEFREPEPIRRDLEAEWGVTLTRQSVSFYNPKHPRFPERWRGVFEAERAAYIAAVDQEALAHQRARLGYLSRAIAKAEATGNLALVGQLVEIGARESGGAYTNRRESQVAMTAAVSVEAEDLLARAEGRDALAPVAADVPPVVQSK